MWVDTTKFTDTIVARFRKCSGLVREGKVFIENKAKVASGVGSSERGVVYFRKVLFKSNKNKFSFRPVATGLGGPKIPKDPQILLCVNGTRQTFSPVCPVSTTCTKLTYLKLWTSSVRNIQNACSWTVCCSTDFDILGLSKY